MPGFQEICTIKADISALEGKLARHERNGRSYWALQIEVAISLGSTSPEARILWKENVSCDTECRPLTADNTLSPLGRASKRTRERDRCRIRTFRPLEPSFLNTCGIFESVTAAWTYTGR